MPRARARSDISNTRLTRSAHGESYAWEFRASSEVQQTSLEIRSLQEAKGERSVVAQASPTGPSGLLLLGAAEIDAALVAQADLAVADGRGHTVDGRADIADRGDDGAVAEVAEEHLAGNGRDLPLAQA